MFNPPALIYDSFLGYCLVRWLNDMHFDNRTFDKVIALGLFFLWLALAKTVKLWGHFYRYPSDMKYIPLSIAFGYFHGVVKLWALFTINAVSDPRASAIRDANRYVRHPGVVAVLL